MSQAKVLFEWSIDKKHIQADTLQSKQGAEGKLQKPAKFDKDGLLIFENDQHILIDEKHAKSISTETFSVEAIIRIDQPNKWGGIIGYSQDNGNHERGWLLGYTNSNYSVKASNGGALQTAAHNRSFSPGQWAHIISVYDGKTLKLYTDGILSKSINLPGKILNDTAPTPFVIGAYKDKDEFFPMEGRIRNIKIHDTALTAAAIKKLAGQTRYEFAVRPKVSFTGPSEALVSWEATQPGKGAIAYGLTKNFGEIATSSESGTQHSIRITGLEPATTYYYRLGGKVDGKNKFSPIYEFTTTMNMSVPEAPEAPALKSPETYALAKKIAALDPQRAGICLVIGLRDGKLAYQIARQTNYKVICIESNQERIQKIRKNFYATGVYGSRISILTVEKLNNIPLAHNTANIIVTEHPKLPCSTTLAHKLLSPNSHLVNINGTTVSKKTKTVKETNDWGHQYGNAANTSNVGESLGGATATTDLQVQWLGRPGGDFGIDRQPRMPAPLAANGRLFHQGHDRLVALDSYNGQVLWGMEIPDLRRVNIPRDCSNWCADKDHLYVAIKDRAWKINAANGKQEEAFMLTSAVRGTHDWGYIAVTDKSLIGSSVKANAAFTNIWTSKAWFDGAGNRDAIAQVISDNIFSYDKTTGKGKWAYGKGVIINSTITISGKNIYFLENQSPNLKEESNGKISSNQLWTENLKAVCLNLETGRPRWIQPFPALKYVDSTKSSVQVGYGVATKDAFLPVLSQAVHGTNKGLYTYHYFDAKTGKLKWEAETPWRANHHGAHIQHPVIIRDKIYCDPTGVKIKTGRPIGYNYGPRAACSAAVGTTDSIFYRGGGGMITIWGVDEKKPTGWKRLRPSCWLSFIPSNGMLLIPEGGAGCSCGGWMETSLGLAPIKK